MTDEEILRAVAKMATDRAYPIWNKTDILNAYRLGWEARGKRDAEVCDGEHIGESVYDSACQDCAIAIEREGKATSHSESDLSGKPARP